MEMIAEVAEVFRRRRLVEDSFACFILCKFPLEDLEFSDTHIGLLIS